MYAGAGRTKECWERELAFLRDQKKRDLGRVLFLSCVSISQIPIHLYTHTTIILYILDYINIYILVPNPCPCPVLSCLSVCLSVRPVLSVCPSLPVRHPGPCPCLRMLSRLILSSPVPPANNILRQTSPCLPGCLPAIPCSIDSNRCRSVQAAAR